MRNNKILYKVYQGKKLCFYNYKLLVLKNKTFSKLVLKQPKTTKMARDINYIFISNSNIFGKCLLFDALVNIFE